jgi:hypothetical protein
MKNEVIAMQKVNLTSRKKLNGLLEQQKPFSIVSEKKKYCEVKVLIIFLRELIFAENDYLLLNYTAKLSE